MILMFLFLRFLRKKESVATHSAPGGKKDEGMWEQRVFLVSRKKINFKIEFKVFLYVLNAS